MENIYTFILASATLAIIPGPDILFVIMQSISNGKKYAIITATGLVTGCIFHTVLAALGISLIFQQSKIAFFTLKIAGALYLLYLAYTSIFNKKSLINNTNISASGFKKGIVMNILNPKVALFFIAFLPQFINKNTHHFVLNMVALGAIFAIISWCIFVICAMLASQFNKYILNNKNFTKNTNIFAAIVYTIIALWLLLD